MSTEKKVSDLILENANEIIESSKQMPNGHFLYIDDNGNVGTCQQNHSPIGSYNILTSRAVNSVEGMVARYQEMEASM